MNENNKETNLGDLPVANVNMPQKKGGSRLILSLVGVVIVFLIASFFVYKNYFSKNPTLIKSQTSAAQEITLKDGYSLYQDPDTSISFQYPQILSVLDQDEDGSKILPKIFFQNYQYPNGHSRNTCPVDCISFSAFIRSGNDVPYYDIPLQVERNNPQFPVYDYPKYVYQDETGSKPFQIHGMEAVRYYAVGLTDSYIDAYAKDKTTPVEYSLEDRVFIKDPSMGGRVIYVVYQEKINKLPANAQSLSTATIKSLFDQQKYAEFQGIIASVKASPVDVNQFTVQSSKRLGVSFQTPKYYGNLIESFGTMFGSSPKVETINLFFKSPLFSWDDPSRIKFEADNSKTSKYVYEGAPPLYQYSGQSLDTACQKNAYLNASGYYDIKMTECNLRTLPNGVKVVVFKGSFASKSEEGKISSGQKQFIPFKGAILQTKSSVWPGMSIHFEGTDNFDSLEKVFGRVVDSLAYGPVLDSNVIVKNAWGVSFSKSQDWEVTSNSDKEVILRQSSGEWVGDIINISYISAPEITSVDSKFGSVTYYFDEKRNQWMVIDQREGKPSTNNGDPSPSPVSLDHVLLVDNLPVFSGSERWMTFIVPLSHTTFLKLNITGSGQTQPLQDLLKTVKKI